MARYNRRMRRWWPFLFILLLCLPATLPYWGGDIPRSNDSLSHLYRAFQLDRLVRAGVFFPRWAPDLAHGYGYPIFNYFAYLSHYVIVFFHLLGLPLLSALRASYITALLASGLSTFTLARDFADGDDRAGLVAAVAYVYSPYVLYTAHVRGGLPENFALAFLPLALWAVRQALRSHHEDSKAQRDTKNLLVNLRDLASSWFKSSSAVYAFLAALAIAGFIFSHAGMALQYLPIISLFGLCVLIARWREIHPFTLPPLHPVILSSHLGFWLLGFGILSLVFTLALSLTAFLWLPTFTDLAYVQYGIAFARSGATYTNNFFQLGELFTYPHLPVYTDVLNPPLVRSLPLLASALAVVGLIRLRSFSPARRADYVSLLALFALTSFLILDLSKPVWDNITLLQRSVLPWRLLGPASLFASALAGLAVSSGRRAVGIRHLSFVIRHSSFAIASLFIASALPFLFPPGEPAPEQPTLADLARYEIPTFIVVSFVLLPRLGGGS
ncbi:MAG: hypothetical protein HYZ49_16050 [Chloroflexi bacterium]|nr:hypothetical protein [Chloroflexota bacterium]